MSKIKSIRGTPIPNYFYDHRYKKKRLKKQYMEIVTAIENITGIRVIKQDFIHPQILELIEDAKKV